MKKILVYILLSLHVFTTENAGVFMNQYFPTVHALSSTWDFSTAGDYTLSDEALVSIQRGYADLDLQLTQTGVLQRDDANNVFLDTPRRTIISGNYAYISAYTPDRIQVIDISNPTTPTAVTSLLNNNTTLMLNGPMDLAISGDYLYVAEYIGDAIQVIDISNPTAPTAAGNYPNSAAVRLNGPRGLTIDDDYLYVASWVDDAIQIFDISSAPTMTPVGELRDGTRLNGARDIIVDGNYAYVSARNGDRIQIIDISDPTSPSFVGEIINDGITTFLDSVFGIDKQGDYIYATGYSQDRIQIIDVSDPTNPTAVANLSTAQLPGLNGPRDLYADGDFLFIGDYIGDSIMVVDISDPTNPIRESELGNSVSTNLNGSTLRMVRIGDLLYFGSYTDDDFVILESGYTTSSPTITPISAFNYGTESLTAFTETLGSNHEGDISYQISKNNGVDWYYHNGTTWTPTTGGVTDSNSASIINANISDFNNIGSGNDFLWRAYLTSDGDERVQLDEIQVDSVAGPILSITKTDNDADNIVQTDQVVRYTLTLTNSGSAATGISITDDIDTDFGIPYNFVYTSCGSPSDNFVDPTLTFSSVEVAGGGSCTIEYDVQVDSLAPGGNTITNSADPSAAVEGGNDPAAASADALTVLACGINDVEIEFNTDNWGEDTYWSLTPTGNACGVGEIANGGNTADLTCASGGAQSANPANGYADNSVIIEGPYSLTVGAQYDLHVIDDWGDGMTSDPDVTIEQNGGTTDTFVVENTGGVFTFIVQEPTGCIDTTSPSLTINQANTQIDPTAMDSATFTVVYNEVINTATFTAADITLSGTTGSVTSGPTQIAPNNGTSFEFSVTGMTDSDTVTASVAAGVVEDIAGNFNTASSSSDNQVTYIGGDTTPPVVTSTSISSGALLPGGNHTLSFEYNDGTGVGVDTSTGSTDLTNNIAPNATITHTPATVWGVPPHPNSIVNGIISTVGDYDYEFHTDPIGNGFIEFNWDTPQKIGDMKIYNRTAACCDQRLTGATIRLYDASNTLLYTHTLGSTDGVNIVDIDFETLGEIHEATTLRLDTVGGNMINIREIEIFPIEEKIQLFKWDGTAWGDDIAHQYIDFSNSSYGTGAASYVTDDIPYGKYRVDLQITDLDANTHNEVIDFYVDEPEFIISTPEIDLGTLSVGSEIFSPTVTVTVLTVGAGFDVTFHRSSPLTEGTELIPSFSGSLGYGYQQTPYSGSITAISTNENIASQAANINTNGNKNSYSYEIQIGALINSEQSSGDYEGTLDFEINLTY